MKWLKRFLRPPIHKRSITLIELMLAVAVLLLVVGGIGFNIESALRASRFKSEALRLKSKIELIQKAATLFRADIHLKIKKGKGGVQGELMLLSPLPKAVQKALEADLFFSSIDSIEVQGVERDKVELIFSVRQGSYFPSLHLLGKRGALFEIAGASEIEECDILQYYPENVLSG